MNTGTEESHKRSAAELQALLDDVPSDRLVACVPTHESLILHDGEKELGRIPLDGIVEVSLRDDTSVQRSYPMGRLLFLGPLALLFPKKTVREAYRLSIQWKDPDGGFNITFLRIPTRTMADHMLCMVERSLYPEVRRELAQKAAKTRERAAESTKAPSPAETSPFITCPHCTMEFRKSDLPPGGKCPVCGQPL
ncbi:MAG: hypothetical protein CVU61_13395 [Deltaproteobacteria bacterium HGW-Deltaproteobacteria-19]|jgi:hypothetical protein|nr:MAG: hypothetical protein CVU61_13395 [Deltaproteobacteria bacterium HGW-Deltaproteobacteria-19]